MKMKEYILTVNYLILWKISDFIERIYLNISIYFPYIPMLFELI